MDGMAYQIVRYLQQHGEAEVIEIARRVFGKHAVTKVNRWQLEIGIYYRLLEMSELVLNSSPMPKAPLEERVEASRWKLK